MRLAISTLVAIAIVASPLNAQQPATTCKDGSTSAATGRGACASHGGVDTKATKQMKKAEKAQAKEVVKAAKATGAMVACTDGTESKPGRGACSRHGGIKLAGAAPAVTPRTRTPSPSPTPTRPRPTPPPSSPAASSSSASAATGSSGKGEDRNPTGAVAQCKDGLYSHAANRRGACARHGGVAKWMST